MTNEAIKQTSRFSIYLLPLIKSIKTIRLPTLFKKANYFNGYREFIFHYPYLIGMRHKVATSPT